MEKLKNTKVQLLRELAKAKELECVFHYIADRKDKIRKIESVMKSGNIKTTAGWLELPQASLVVFYPHRHRFEVYAPAERPTTAEEQAKLDMMNSLCTPEEQERDMMSDGNVCFWREKRFRESNKIGKMSMEEWYWKRYHHGKVRDPKLRGEKLYEFKIIY